MAPSGHRPPAKPFPIPFTQDFDQENVSAPPAYWYDQMGAWEVQNDPSKPGNRLMRQVSPVWPACWGYSCTGPMTYFGPKAFNASGSNGFTISLDVKVRRCHLSLASLRQKPLIDPAVSPCPQLEKDAVFGIGGSTGGKGFAGVLLDSKNSTFTMGGQSGSATFATGKFHKVRLASGLRLRPR